MSFDLYQSYLNNKLISGINLWEISLKYSLGKLELGGTDPSLILDTLLKARFEVAELESRLLATYDQLPHKEDHRSAIFTIQANRLSS
ncbi:MAG: hypothetical protein KC423_00835 [Anaerolineales bacterium]|nr:hypothetical protein [Anaerolineales bacterium]